MKENCVPYRDLIPANALDALDPDEARIVQAHLRTCQDCQAALDEYREVSDGLLLAMPPKAPPPRVRARLIASLAESRMPAPASKRRAWPVWGLVGGLAVAALLILNIFTLSQILSLQRQQAALINQMRSDQVALALVAYPDGRTFPVNSPTGEAGMLVMNSELKAGVLFAWGLPPVDQAHTYQIWLIQPDGQRVSGGLFRPEPGQATTSAVIQSSRPFTDFTGMGVTVEPAGGSPGPTGERVLSTSF